jgi:hypothetical protein
MAMNMIDVRAECETWPPKRAIREFGITEPERQKRLAAYRVA